METKKWLGAIAIILLAICQLPLSSCSRKLHTETSLSEHYGEKTYDQPVTTQHLKVDIAPAANTLYARNTPEGKDRSDLSASRIIETARNYIGIPHCMGGFTTRCMDCSGMVMIVFAEHGITLPHNAQEQSKYGELIQRKEDLREGDLVFFKESYKTTRYITHSGIYVGDGRFIHASVSEGVTITSLDDKWWKDKYVFGTRILMQQKKRN